MAAKLLGPIDPGSTSEVQWRPKKLLPFSNVLNAILTYDRKLYLVKLKFYFIYNEIEHGKKSTTVSKMVFLKFPGIYILYPIIGSRFSYALHRP